VRDPKGQVPLSHPMKSRVHVRTIWRGVAVWLDVWQHGGER
jgi:hypothetical protein